MVSVVSTPACRTRANGWPAILRRLGGLVAGCVLLLGLQAGAWADPRIVLTDAAGRSVRLAAPARRIVTNESLLLLSLALIDRDPVARLAGWAAPQRLDRGIYDTFRQRFPAIDDIPAVGAVVPANFAVEAVLDLDPDLFVVSLWDPGWSDIAAQLEAAGIPVLFLDGPANAPRDPAGATVFSIELLGKAIGRERESRAFAAFVRSRYERVAARLAARTERPTVLVDAHAGIVCCNVPGRNNRISQHVALAGGRIVGAEGVAGYDGRVSPEYVLDRDPDIYIATAGPHMAGPDGLMFGGKADADAARAALRAVVGRNLLGELTAVREGRAFAVSHQLAISWLNVLMLECFAAWIHPDLFGDIDPAATLAEINDRFLAVPLAGTFWIALPDGAGSRDAGTGR